MLTFDAQKKEFPKAQEALHKLPEKEKNDIERKFRTVRSKITLHTK